MSASFSTTAEIPGNSHRRRECAERKRGQGHRSVAQKEIHDGPLGQGRAIHHNAT